MPDTAARPRGRPSKKTPDTIATICDVISSGGLLEDAEKASGVDVTTILLWEQNDPEFFYLLARARKNWAATTAEKGVQLYAAEPRMISGGEDGADRVDSGWVTHLNNRMNYLRWLMAKRDPERFGDKSGLNVNLTGQVDHHHTISDERRKELMAMKQSAIERRLAARKAKQIEAKP